jgi:hypothetical protein
MQGRARQEVSRHQQKPMGQGLCELACGATRCEGAQTKAERSTPAARRRPSFGQENETERRTPAIRAMASLATEGILSQAENHRSVRQRDAHWRQFVGSYVGRDVVVYCRFPIRSGKAQTTARGRCSNTRLQSIDRSTWLEETCKIIPVCACENARKNIKVKVNDWKDQRLSGRRRRCG